jgi:hypothetical protein
MQLPDLFTSAKFVLFSATVSGVVCSSLPAIAQTISLTSDPVSASQSGPVATLDSGTMPTEIMFNPPGGNAPQDTRGGASRSGDLCFIGTQSDNSAISNQLTGLVPESNYGLTLAERPVFFAYVPPTDAESMMFTLRDEQGQTIYQAAIPPSTQGGIVSVSLPETVAPLALGTNYQWAFAVLCDGQLRPDSPFVMGWVQRIAPDAEMASLADQSPIEQATQYSEAGIWYDALTTLATLRQQHPTDAQLANLWAGFLNSVNLEELATMPLIE